MMKIKTFVLTLILVLLFGTFVHASASMPEGLKESALEGLGKFISINIDEFNQFGYKSTDEMLEATLSNGYPIYIIDYSKINDSKKANFKDIIIPTNQWQFIVESKGKSISFLRVEENSGKYEAILFGGDASYYNGAINKFKNDKKVEPILIMDGNKFFLLYVGPNNKETIMNIPSPSAVKQGESAKYNETEAILENLKVKTQKYKNIEKPEEIILGSSSDLNLLDEATNKEDSNTILLIFMLLISGVAAFKFIK